MTWAEPPGETEATGNAGLSALAAARTTPPRRVGEAERTDLSAALDAGTGPQPSGRGSHVPGWPLVAAVVLALAGVAFLLLRGPGDGAGDGGDLAWEIAWEEQTTTQQSEVTGCLQYTSFGRCFQPEYSYEQVPGPVATRRDVVCASSHEDAERLAADFGRQHDVIAEVVAGPLDPNTCEAASPTPTAAARAVPPPAVPPAPAAPAASPARVERAASDLAIAVGYCYDMTLRYPATLAATKTCDSSQRYFKPLPSTLRVACWRSTGSALTFVIEQPSTYATARYDSSTGRISTRPQDC